MSKENYVPEKFDDSHFKVLIQVGRCASCNRLMIQFGRQERESLDNHMFPFYYKANLPAQLARANIQFRGNSKINDAFICEICDAEGKASFTCALCGQIRKSNEQQESFGDPPEILCKNCYATVPAKEWNEKVEKLRAAHRYDFE